MVDILDDDEEDPFEKEQQLRYSREKKIENLIKFAFNKIGLQIDEFRDYAVIYDEESNREATVYLDDSSTSLSTLIKLKETGLSNDFTIHSSSDGSLRIEFHVNPALDRTI